MAADLGNLFPDISGSEKIKESWEKLLTRDKSGTTSFSAASFPTGLDDSFIGLSVYRTDLKRKFTYLGNQGGEDLWKDDVSEINSDEILFEDTSNKFPEDVSNVKEALEFLESKSQSQSIVIPSDELEFISDGIKDTFELTESISNKAQVSIYCSGVKQAPSTFDIVNNGKALRLKVIPNINEIINIKNNASVLEYNVSPELKTFLGDGINTEFDVLRNIPSVLMLEVNIDGKVLQKSEFQIIGTKVVITPAPILGAKIEILTTHVGSVVVPPLNSITEDILTDNSVSENKLKDGSVSSSKLASNSVGTSQLIDGSVTPEKINSGAISGSKITDGSIGLSKLNSNLKGKLLGTENIETINLKNKVITLAKLAQDVLDLISTNAVPDASISQKGIGMLTTLAQVQAGNGGNKLVTSDILHSINENLKTELANKYGYHVNLLNIDFTELPIGISSVKVTSGVNVKQPEGTVSHDTDWIVHVDEIKDSSNISKNAKFITVYGGETFQKVWRALVTVETSVINWTLIQAPIIRGESVHPTTTSWMRWEIDEVNNTLFYYGCCPDLPDGWTLTWPVPFADNRYVIQGEQMGTDATGNLGTNVVYADKASGNHVGSGIITTLWSARGRYK